jgi:hypothetical protein
MYFYLLSIKYCWIQHQAANDKSHGGGPMAFVKMPFLSYVLFIARLGGPGPAGDLHPLVE